MRTTGNTAKVALVDLAEAGSLSSDAVDIKQKADELLSSEKGVLL